jgi:hypothetical protein
MERDLQRVEKPRVVVIVKAFEEGVTVLCFHLKFRIDHFFDQFCHMKEHTRVL